MPNFSGTSSEDIEKMLRALFGSMIAGASKNEASDTLKKESSGERKITFKNNYAFTVIKYIFIGLKITLVFLWRILRFLDVFIDKYLTIALYKTLNALGAINFYISSVLYRYIKDHGYVDDDKFEQKMSRERKILLGFGMSDTKKITIRETMYELNVSEGDARFILDVAKNYMDYFNEYKDIMSNYKTDSEKKDKRSTIKEKVYY